MRRWIIRENGIRQGQASSWHKALDLLMRQEDKISYKLIVSTYEHYKVLIEDKLFDIKLEDIN